MEITRNIIQDLLPVYLAGEASADTIALVEQYLPTDPELTRIARQAAAPGLAEVPVPLSQETAMETYRKANQWLVVRTLGLAVVIAAVFLCTFLPGLLVVVMFFAPK